MKKFALGSIGALLASVLIETTLGPFAPWVSLLIFLVPLALANVVLARRQEPGRDNPSVATPPSRARRSFNPWVYVFAAALFLWFYVDHLNERKWGRAFDEGTAAFTSRNYANAETRLKVAVSIAQKLNNPTNLCKSQNYLGNTYLNEGKHEDSRNTFEAAIRSCAHSRNASDLIAAYASLGAAYEQLGGNNEGAETALKKALELAHQNLQADDPQLASVLNNLGAVKQSQGRYSEAEVFFRQAVSIWQHTSGADLGSGYSNLGHVLFLEGKLAEAEGLYRQSLEIAEKDYGPNSPETAPVLNNLAVLYQREKKFNQAKELLQRAISNAENAQVPNMSRIETLKKNYTDLLEEARKQ